MAIIRMAPFKGGACFQKDVSRIFEGDFPEGLHEDETGRPAFRPAADIYQTGKAIVIEVDLPGVAREEVELDVRQGVLRISGERRFVRDPEETRRLRQERAHGRFFRAFALPDDTAPDGISARMREGVLTISIPLPEQKGPRQVPVS